MLKHSIIASILFFPSTYSMQTLQELATDALIKKWQNLPGLSVPSAEEVKQIHFDVQNDLIKKMMVPVYQFFVQKAVWAVAKEKTITYINKRRETKKRSITRGL